MFGGLVHQFKKKIFHGEKHVDADYEAAHAKFVQVSDSLHKLKTSAHAYSTSLYSLTFNSGATATEFLTMLEDGAQDNPYKPLARDLKAAHTSLSSGDRATALTQRLQESVLAPLDAHMVSFLDINGRVAKRNELHESLEYYLNKVSALNKERDQRAAQGKGESSSQREKLERNHGKLDKIRQEYTTFSGELIKDLHAAWSKRVEVLGPALVAFVRVEKEFAAIYQDTVSPIQVDAYAGPSSLAVPNAGLGVSGSPRPSTPVVAALHTPLPQQQLGQQTGQEGTYGAGVQRPLTPGGGAQLHVPAATNTYSPPTGTQQPQASPQFVVANQGAQWGQGQQQQYQPQMYQGGQQQQPVIPSVNVSLLVQQPGGQPQQMQQQQQQQPLQPQEAQIHPIQPGGLAMGSGAPQPPLDANPFEKAPDAVLTQPIAGQPVAGEYDAQKLQQDDLQKQTQYQQGERGSV